MRRIRENLLSSFVGQAWSAAMGFAVVPIYIRSMGIEGYGLVGFYLTLQAALQILDFGLSPTMNREMARYSVRPDVADQARDFVRTLEVGYVALGVAIGAAIAAAAPYLAAHWFHAGALPEATVRRAIAEMGLLAAVQWPLSFYQGGLVGLQRLRAVNGVLIAASTLRSAGGALILTIGGGGVTALFGWLALVSAGHVAALGVLLWRALPVPAPPRAPRFDAALLRGIRRFAAGVSGIALLSLVLTQVDKVLLSRLLTLEAFGYYSLAASAAGALLVVVTPVFNVIFPRFSSLVEQRDEAALRTTYHAMSQLMAVLTLPIAAVLALFAHDALFTWTASAATADGATPALRFLVIGAALNGMMYLPYALQLAHGWTRLSLAVSAVMAGLLVPALLVAVPRYGAIAAAVTWAALNVCSVLVVVPSVHRRYLRGAAPRWLARDFGAPLVAATAAALLVRQLVPAPTPGAPALATIAAAYLAALTAAASTSSVARSAAHAVRLRAVAALRATQARRAP